MAAAGLVEKQPGAYGRNDIYITVVAVTHRVK